MPKRYLALVAAAVLVVLGCQQSPDFTPTSIQFGDAAQMRLNIAVAPELNIVSGEVTITKGDLEYSQQFELVDSTATVLFADLQPGLWTIEVVLYDGDGNPLYEGSGEAEIHGGQTATAHIVLTELSGDLEITIELPPDGESGLIAYYPFDGSAVDQSGHGHDGAVFGATPTEDRFGNPDSAYLFDGVDDYINVGQAPDFPSWASYTVAVWIRDDGTGEYANYGAKIIDKTIMMHDWYLSVQDAGQIVFVTHESGGDVMRDDTADYRDSLWHFLVVTKNGGLGRLFVDGLPVDATGDIKTVFSSGDLIIGYCESDDALQRRHFGGAIDDIRIYDRALNDNEIDELYEASEPTSDPYADAVVSYTVGDGVSDGNDDPNAALGAPEYNDQSGSGTFVSLGRGGSIVLAFTNNQVIDGPGDDLTVVEVGSPENAEILVSQDGGVTFVSLGEAHGETSFDLSGTGLESVNTIRIVDLPPDGSSDTTGGFDLDAVVAITGELPPASEPIQWTEAEGGNGHWYELVKTLKNWPEARQAASERSWNGLNGYLATITSAEESEWLWSWLQGEMGGVWECASIGGYQDPPDSTPPLANWKWVTDEPWDYTHWVPGEPNDYTGIQEYCLTMYGWGTYGGYWNDDGSDDHWFWLVEYEEITEIR